MHSQQNIKKKKKSQDLLHFHNSLMSDKQTSDVCVANQRHLLRWVTNYMNCGKSTTVTAKISGKCAQMWTFTK